MLKFRGKEVKAVNRHPWNMEVCSPKFTLNFADDTYLSFTKDLAEIKRVDNYSRSILNLTPADKKDLQEILEAKNVRVPA